MAGKAKEAAVSTADIVAGGEQGGTGLDRPLRPRQCRAYMRRELAREFPGIVRGFIESAKKGNCQHVKLATELMETPKRAPKQGKSTVERLLEEMEAGYRSSLGDGEEIGQGVGEGGAGQARSATGRYT